MPNSLPHRIAVGFKWELTSTLIIYSKRSWQGKKNAHLWHAGQKQYGPLPLSPLAQSQIEHLQQINFPWCVAAPLAAHRPRTQHLLPFLTISWLLSAGRHNAYNCGLSKAFTTGYKMDLQTRSQDKPNMLLFIHCPDEKLNLALLTRKDRY